MNWTAIGALGEIAGAVAVVVSLAYLSVQIRANSRALNVTIRNDVQKEINQWNQTIMMDGPTLTILHKGCQVGVNALGEEERLQFAHTMYSLLTMWETIFEHARDGVIDGGKLERVSKIFALFVCTPGGREYWAHRMGAFDPEFGAMVDRIGASDLLAMSELGSPREA